MKQENIHDLLPKIDEYHQALTPEIRQYLNGRGIDDEVIDRRKIGLGKHCGKLWITMPVADAKGKPIQMILRKPPDAPEGQMRYKIPKDGKSVLFGADSLASDPDIILCCEGVLDACAAESLGFCAISSTTGVNTFPDAWFDHIPNTPKTRKFIICFDTDEAGEKGSINLLCKIAIARPDLELQRIELPAMSGKDLTDFLVQCTEADKKQALLSLARPYVPQSPRDRLIDTLSTEMSFTSIAPSQGICEGWGYYGVTLRQERRLTTFIVTSERNCFPCTEEEWLQRGQQSDREPAAEAAPRWDQKQLVQFLKGEGEVLSLADSLVLVKQKLMQYVDFTDPRAFSVTAAWIMLTYFYRLFPAIPYLHLTGLKGAGKTKVMQIISLLAFNGELVTSSSSPASITRLVHNNGATLGVDEAEALWSAKDENNIALQDILRSGYKSGILVTKCEKNKEGKQIVIRLDPFSPKALSGIRGLEDALSSRCIEVLMFRTTNKEVANTEIQPSSSEWKDLRALLYPAALMAMPEVHKMASSFSIEKLTGRNAELWKPLLLLAEVAHTKKLREELLTYALEQTAKRNDNDADAEIGKLLTCLDELLGVDPKKFVPAEDIFDLLGKDDDLSWMTDPKHKSSRGRWLNGRLKRLGLWDGPADLRSIYGEKKRGYELERTKLNKAAERLCVSLSSGSVTPDTAMPQSSP